MSSKKFNITDRLKKIMGDMSQREFARNIGISSSTLWEYLSGRIPPADFIVRVCEHYSVSEHWLLTGKGKMYRRGAGAPPVDIKDIPLYNMKEWLEEFWQKADEDEKVWLKIEFVRHFPEYQAWLQKKQDMAAQEDAGAESKSDIA